MASGTIYTSGEYLDKTGGTWHAEDSPWKASHVLKMIEKHDLHPSVVVEVGCGSGVVLQELSAQPQFRATRFEGFDLSSDAIAMANRLDVPPSVQFHQSDPLDDESEAADILLALDVFEHVRDYMGFLERCQRKAEYKIYHIPLDISVLSVIRNFLPRRRHDRGHLHYFVADSALDTLRDTGHEVVDYSYTEAVFDLFWESLTFNSALAFLPRWIVSRFSVPLAARYFGGFSLLVLAR